MGVRCKTDGSQADLRLCPNAYMHSEWEMMMENKGILMLAAAGAAAALFIGGIFPGNTVFAAEEGGAINNGISGNRIHAFADTEARKAYKRDRYGDVGCRVILPEGYVRSGTTKGMYLSERNPLDSSNIYYAVSENVDAEEIKCLLDSGDYQIRMEEKLKETYGSQASLVSFHNTELDISGCPAYKVEVSCQMDNAVMEQLIYIIIADKTYTLTYSQSADDERMEEFQKSGETIEVVFADE